VFVSFRPSYDRGYEDLRTTDKIFDMMVDYLKAPFTGLIPRLTRLRRYCDDWAGPNHAEKLFDALVNLQEAFKHQSATVPVRPMTWGISVRHVPRPLVVVPSNLTQEEEAYWLPHVFNVSREEARQDYIDLHGGRARPFNVHAVGGVIGRLSEVSIALEDLPQAPEQELFARSAKSLRIYCCFIRSGGNFYAAQMIRDRNKEKLSQISPRPPKEANWTGDPDLTQFNEIMRDELDNAQDLIGLLENGGMELISYAKDPSEEDTFLLGPGLIDQLRAKRLIMRRHWLDIQNHLATPHK
jgi:hypothetical protein